jgi:hypothetical protein
MILKSKISRSRSPIKLPAGDPAPEVSTLACRRSGRDDFQRSPASIIPPALDRSIAVPSGFRLALILVSGSCLTAFADDPPIPEPLKPPGFEEFVVIPIKVHVLSSTDLPDVNCGLTDADIKRVLGKVNGIWHQAGVHWGLDTLVREPAAKQEEFQAALKLREDAEGDMLAPEGSRSSEGVDVYYIHKFSVNGVYLGNRMAFVQETAKLRPVPGGIDEPLPRVTAHELGHALGLPHRQDRTNLLASGNNGTTLNEAEVARSRKRAESMPGSLNVPDLRKKVEELLAKGETSEARKLLAWLAEVPGRGADEAREKLDALPAGIEKKEDAKPASP